MKKIKRFVAMILCVVVLTSSFASIHYETVKSAEWVAGAVASVGGGPLLTALLVGGVVVAGGIAVYEFMQTDSEDYSSFYNGVKTGFNEFVAEQEKKIALEQNSSLTDQEASDIGVANARETVNSFFSNTIDNVKATTKTVKTNAYEYWDLYSRLMGNVADNGISESSEITDSTPISTKVINETSYSGFSNVGKLNYGRNTKTYEGNYYLVKGQYMIQDQIRNIDYSNATYFSVPFMWVQMPDSTSYIINICVIKIDSLGNLIGIDTIDSTSYGTMADLNRNILGTEFPTYINNMPNYVPNETNIRNNWKTLFSVSAGASVIPNYVRTIDTTLKNTHIGKSIQTGRKQLVNSGDYVGSIFVEDSLPIKKSGLKVNEGVATGTVGWDIPASDTWDDYLAGNLPFPDVVGGTGTIVVPKGNVTDYPSDNTVDFPSDTTVTDSNPKVDDDTGEENPETSPDEVIQDQAGSFYPTALDLTNIFPFCIPFDIIYLVQMYANVEEEAPVIDFEIPYPDALKSSLGDSYHVEVDFADYVSVRNVLRIFILLLFVVGLMKITRDLIRG